MNFAEDTIEKLSHFDTPTICNVIELFHVRPRNVGYVDHRVQSQFPEFAPMDSRMQQLRKEHPLKRKARLQRRSEVIHAHALRVHLWGHVACFQNREQIFVQQIIVAFLLYPLADFELAVLALLEEIRVLVPRLCPEPDGPCAQAQRHGLRVRERKVRRVVSSWLVR